MASLTETTRALMKDGKGILDAGLGNDALDALLSASMIAPSAEARKSFRDVLIRSEGIERYLSGAVLSEDALLNTAEDATTFYDALSEKKMLTGISMPLSGETSTGIESRLTLLRSSAVVFAKFEIASRTATGPADITLKEDIRSALEAVRIAHASSVTPIIAAMPSARGAHTAGEAEDRLVETASLLSDALESSTADVKNVILGLSFAATGLDNPAHAPAEEVAERTYRALTSSVPETAGGIVFFSEDGDAAEAVSHMNALARREPFPWPITFAFGSAHQASVLAAWMGSEENISDAKSAYLRTLGNAVAADTGGYSSAMQGG